MHHRRSFSATVAVPTQRLSHAFGGPATPSSHMSVVSVVIVDLPKTPGHRLSGNNDPSPHGDTGKETMEIDDNDLGHLS